MTSYRWVTNRSKDYQGPCVDETVIPFCGFIYYEVILFTSGEEICSRGDWVKEKSPDYHTLFDKELSSWN